MTDYERIESAILYIRDNFKDQPTLDDIARHVHLSAFHFQRLFTDWAGVSPKKFLQFLNVEYAKKLLKNNSLSTTSFETGLSGSSRLHDLFINIEGMTPGEFKNGGQALIINYNFEDTPFGKVLIASTKKGICYLEFIKDELVAFKNLENKFPRAVFNQRPDEIQGAALSFFKKDDTPPQHVRLHLKGSAFQLKVWESLLKIPSGSVTSYSDIAKDIKSPLASRAVGTAIGSNVIAFLIPCHRVIRSSGIIGDYRWGSPRKAAIIGWEASLLK